MSMTKKSMVAGLFAAVAVVSQAADISRIIVRQQWPWSTDVKVECELSGATAESPVDLEVKVFNGNAELKSDLLEESIYGERFAITNGGVKTFFIDPVKAFGETAVTLSDFRVKVSAVPSADKYAEVIYKIVNLESPYDVQNVTRAMLLNGEMGAVETKYSDIHPDFNTGLEDVVIWTGVTNDVKYKTSHLVLRKIPAKNKTFLFGKGIALSNEVSVLTAKGTTTDGIPTSFTNDFYLGVFELTQSQWLKMRSFPDGSAWETNALYADTRPVNRCYYSAKTRGTEKGLKWPEGDHTDVDDDTFFKLLQDRVGLVLDFPTEAMWEFACRAGTETGLHIGTNSTVESFVLISRQRNVNRPDTATSPDRNCDLSDGPAQVGTYLPNAWGLYDMYGNVWERCLDVYDLAYVFPAQMTDPRGSPNSSLKARVVKGGSYVTGRFNNRDCPMRGGVNHGDADRYTGIRVCLYPDFGL